MRRRRLLLRPRLSDDSSSSERSPLVTSLLCGTVILLSALASDASAQDIRGRAVDTETAAPVRGGLVSLVDTLGRSVDTTLTRPDGRFHLRAPSPGRYRLLLERIGLETWTSDLFFAARGESLFRRIEAPPRPIELRGLVTTAESECSLRPEESDATARIWNETRKALQTVSMGEHREWFRFRARRWERKLDPRLRVDEERTWNQSNLVGTPFRSPEATRLDEGGYVRGRINEGRTYFAPDAEALLSDSFLEGHCFGIREAPDADPNLVGLEFEPKSRSDDPDVKGVLWVDRENARLRHAEIRYVNLGLGPGVPTGKLKARIDFERLPDGLWIVRRWNIRMPTLGRRTLRVGNRLRQELQLVGYREVGGEVIDARPVGERARPAVDAERISVGGVVYDSTQGEPLEGARIVVDGGNTTALTGPSGGFEISDLAPGRITLTVEHAKLRMLGVRLVRDLSLRAGERRTIRLAIPSTRTLLGRSRSGERAPADEGSPPPQDLWR